MTEISDNGLTRLNFSRTSLSGKMLLSVTTEMRASAGMPHVQISRPVFDAQHTHRLGVHINMKIKAFSWILAGVYLLCGVMFFVVIPQFESIFSGWAVPVPSLTRAVFAIGPFCWLSLAVTVGALAILKDLKFRSRLLDLIFLMLLALLGGCIVVALLILPFMPLR